MTKSLPPPPEATWRPRWSYASSTGSSLLPVASPVTVSRIIWFVALVIFFTAVMGVILAIALNKDTTIHHHHKHINATQNMASFSYQSGDTNASNQFDIRS